MKNGKYKYQIYFTKRADKEKFKIKSAGLEKKTRIILKELSIDPYAPPREKLVGNLAGFYSKRINIQHRLVYKIDEEEKKVVILKMWTHYE